VSNTDSRGFVAFIEQHKGGVALTLALLLYLASWPLAIFNPAAASLVRAAGEASLVGGLCDYIALNMLFEEHWYLPKSGVLPRNREKLIDGIAQTIEREWLTPDMVGQKIHDLKPLDRLGEYLQGAALRTMIRPAQLERICNEMARSLEPEVAIGLMRRLTTGVSNAGLINRLRAAILTALINKECARLRDLIRGLPDNDEMLAAADEQLHEFGARLRDTGSTIRKTADHWMDALVRELVIASRGEIARMVKENLSSLSNEAIRDQIETRTRTHLDWIRVNGGVFGAILGCAFALLNAARPELLIRHLSALPVFSIW
jgi:uncharacterized membrane-anchored protein YjiN (DUF445 family)